METRTRHPDGDIADGRAPDAAPGEDEILRKVFEGTATETGARFFDALVRSLAEALGTHGAWVTEYLPESGRLRALAFWLGDGPLHDFEHPIEGTPCAPVIEERRLVHFADRIVELYPDKPMLQQVGAVSYMGVPLLDPEGRVLGHLAVLDSRPMPHDPRSETVLRIFAARAGAELARIRAEAAAAARKEKLGRLVQSAMDAILELDAELRITLANEAAEKVFGVPRDRLEGRGFPTLLAPASVERLARLAGELAARGAGPHHEWVAGGLSAVGARGEPFPAEATLSHARVDGRSLYTLVLRDVNERVEAERRIHSLSVEAEYLRDEIARLHDVGSIVGQSEPMRAVLRDVAKVAGTDATVLIAGETGTGKELVARAIHEASPRKARPLIKVNCAAIPAQLIESEFFGHEKGAFTGATSRREGRFTLADGGTIFLDEIGELPIDLQAKLLRVLQEGELEPVGSARTQKVDVRVLAATNRDLASEVKHGRFREDLYYRLNVFPIHVPPLRERGADVMLLARHFVAQHAKRLGRRVDRIGETSLERLARYAWPGNVRELENVIERSLILSEGAILEVEDPRLSEAPTGAPPAATPADEPLDLDAVQRGHIVRVLERVAWRISGAGGAADLLGMNPSTLRSRMRKLRIERA